MEEFELLDLEELSKEHGSDKAIKFLQHKLSKGYKVSIMIKKWFNFHLPPLQQRKNEVFSKSHVPYDNVNKQINQADVTVSERMASSTSSLSIKKITVAPTQLETPSNKNPDKEQSEDQIDLYHVRDDSFQQGLKQNSLHQKIQTAIEMYQSAKLRDSLQQFVEVYGESYEFIKSGDDKLAMKMHIFLCVQALCYSSQVLRSLGSYQDASRQLDKCLQTFEINDMDVLSKIYMEKAHCNLLLNQYVLSLEYYNKALILYEQFNWKLDIARVLLKIAYIYAILNSVEDAKKICYEALNIYMNKLGQHDVRIYDTYFTLGVVHYHQKDYDFAIEYLNMAMEGYKKIFGEKCIQIVKILNLLGVIQHLQGSSLQAIEFYEQAVCVYGDGIHLGLAAILNNLALAYLDKMKFKSAKMSFEKAISILKEYYGEAHANTQRVIKNKELVAMATLSYL